MLKEIKSPTFKKEILVPLIPGLVVAFIYDLFKSFSIIVFSKILPIISLFSKNFNNSLYKNFSSADFNSLELLTFTLLIIFYFIFILSDYIKMYFYSKNIFNLTKEKISKLELIKETPSEKNNVLEEVFSEFSIIENSLKKISRNLKIAIVLSLIVYLSYSVYFIGKCQYISLLRNNTLTNIEILSPYISDIEYKTLKSEFYSVDNYDDYTKLSAQINDIGYKNNLKLK